MIITRKSQSLPNHKWEGISFKRNKFKNPEDKFINLNKLIEYYIKNSIKEIIKCEEYFNESEELFRIYFEKEIINNSISDKIYRIFKYCKLYKIDNMDIIVETSQDNYKILKEDLLIKFSLNCNDKNKLFTSFKNSLINESQIEIFKFLINNALLKINEIRFNNSNIYKNNEKLYIKNIKHDREEELEITKIFNKSIVLLAV